LIRNNQNRRRRGGNGPRPQQMGGGNNYGNRLDNRQRGNASQLLEKYRALARDAQQAGDRVTAEYYLQYAEHYYRVLGDYRDKQPEQNRQRGRDFYEDDANGYGGDDAEAGDEDSAEARPQAYGDDRDDDREEPRTDSRNDSRNDDGRSWQGERPRERNRDPQGREPRRDDNREQGNREQGGREQGGRERQPWNGDGQRRDRGERRDRPEQRDRRPERSEPRADSRPEPRAAEPAEGPIPGLPGPATLRINRPPAEEPPVPAAAVAVETEGEPAPRRRGRPRKVVADAEG
jgi:hypothetical protein